MPAPRNHNSKSSQQLYARYCRAIAHMLETIPQVDPSILDHNNVAAFISEALLQGRPLTERELNSRFKYPDNATPLKRAWHYQPWTYARDTLQTKMMENEALSSLSVATAWALFFPIETTQCYMRAQLIAYEHVCIKKRSFASLPDLTPRRRYA